MFILAGIVAAIAVMYVIARRRGMDPEFILDVAPWVVVAGIVGARAYYIVLKAGYFAEHPGEALNVRLGGLTIHGALAGGILAFAWFCWRRRQPFLAWTDVVIAAVPIGQAIGRWGNWLTKRRSAPQPISLGACASIRPTARRNTQPIQRFIPRSYTRVSSILGSRRS
jgi:phosphatidylglycerol:prolipoprotein diacylglycerol transferase